MNNINQYDDHQFVDQRDLQYIRNEPDAMRREAAFCAVTAHRTRDHLEIGDPVPPLELAQLKTSDTVNLGANRDQPLVLIFGSYT